MSDDQSYPVDRQEQLDRIEDSLNHLRAQVAQVALQRRSVRTLAEIMLVHLIAGSGVAMIAELVNGALFYGWFAGFALSVGCWHGSSLRPWATRWKISLLSTCVCFLSTCWGLSIDLGSLLADSVAGWFSLIALSAAAGARAVCTYLGIGLLAPDGPSVSSRRISLWSLLALATQVAVLLGLCRLIDGWGGAFGGDQTGLPGFVHLLGFGGLYGGFGVLAWVLWKRSHTPIQRGIMIVISLLTVIVVNVILSNLTVYTLGDGSEGIWSWQDLVDALPFLLGFTVFLLASPIYLACTLMSARHDMQTQTHPRLPEPPSDPWDGSLSG